METILISVLVGGFVLKLFNEKKERKELDEAIRQAKADQLADNEKKFSYKPDEEKLHDDRYSQETSEKERIARKKERRMKERGKAATSKLSD